MSVRLQLELGEHLDAVADRLADWARGDMLRRMWDRDHTVWSPTPLPELTDRLGWLDLPDRLLGLIPSLESFGAELKAADIAHVVVLGMGGSSLAPEVYFETLGAAEGHPDLRVLDSTHPAAVVATAEAVDLKRTLFVVASKSGTTIEPLSFMEYFWKRMSDVTARPGSHFVATTDPASKLEALAAERGFRRVFRAPPDVGGRYSALTEFGMVPAAAIGADLRAMQAAAAAEQARHSPAATIASAPGCRLGAALGELALEGRDKVTFLTSPDLAALPAWIEQLIAESTGKNGTGIVPIAGEPLTAGTTYGTDRFFVVIRSADAEPIDEAPIAHHPRATMTLDATTDITGAMYIFEVATALAGAVLGIQPFDQPDVQLAKQLAHNAMSGSLDTSAVVEHDAMAEDLGRHVADWLDGAQPGEYIGIQAFIAPTDEARRLLGKARTALRDATGLATTLDFGPRFLHSSGQLHKGGPNSGLFLEIIDHPTPQVVVPTTDYDFGKLITAQAIGDHLALRQRDRRVLLVCLGDDTTVALQRLTQLLAETG